MRVAVLGATGHVGGLVVVGVISAADLELAAAVTRPGSPRIGDHAAGVPIAALGPGCFGDADVVVDFSLPDGLVEALPLLGGRPLVTGTTGLDAAGEARLDAYAREAPVVAAANFSTGVTLLLALVARAAGTLAEYDCEIVEAHHRRKRDAPSGTALALAEAAADARRVALDAVAVHGRSGQTGPRPDGQIGLHAVRAGDVVGEQTVWLAAEGERLELRHVASSRATFAQGALRAARWVVGRSPGRYGMRDVLSL